MSKVFRLSLIVIGLVALLIPTIQAQESVVYGVFFYSPTCPHCHEVMTNHWPGIEKRFGNQLKVLFVDVTTPEGRDLMLTAMDAMPLESGVVPQLIIGTEVLVGSRDIPLYAPTIIGQGLAAGGVAYPAIPNIESWFMEAGLDEFSLRANTSSLSADPANFMAIIVLFALIISLFLMVTAVWQVLGLNNSELLTAFSTQIGWWMLLVATLTGFGLALTLLFGGGEPGVIALASIIALIFIASVAIIGNKATLHEIPNWLVPLTIIVGILSAAYLSYIELTLSDAVCGAMGDCNMVQKSDYAYIGSIPVGFIGLAAYVAMLLVWLIGRGGYKSFTDSVLLSFTVLGTAFSIYLTFLEPFVIGASCVWCLISAVTMLTLLWLITPSVLETWLPKHKHQESYDEPMIGTI
jgi:uncharacterized membrane protein